MDEEVDKVITDKVMDTVMDKEAEDGKARAERVYVKGIDAKYINSGSWKCGEYSPTGAHYWIYEWDKTAQDNIWICIFCGDRR